MRKRNERVRASIPKQFNTHVFQLRPYRVENTPSRPIWQVKQRWAWLVLFAFLFSIFFRLFKVLMNYYSCKSFEKKKFFLSTKKLNFNELLTHKWYEKNIFISSKKNFLSSNRVGIKVIWIKVWFHRVRQIVWAQNQFIKMVNWKIYHWKIMARIIRVVF